MHQMYHFIQTLIDSFAAMDVRHNLNINERGKTQQYFTSLMVKEEIDALSGERLCSIVSYLLN